LYLIRSGFTRRKPRHNFKITSKQTELRLDWTKKHRDFIFAPEIIFTDECSIWLFDNNHEGWFRVGKDSEIIVDKRSGKIHCWGAINMMHGKVAFVTFRDNLNGLFYKSILEEDFLPNANALFPGGYFLQGNDSKHTSKVATNFIKKKCV